MASGRLFGSPWETIKLLLECLLVAAVIVIVIGGAMGLLIHFGRVGIPS